MFLDRSWPIRGRSADILVPVRVPSLSRAHRCHGVEIKKE